MYKFTNGIVVFTEEDKENFLKAGLKLVEEENEDEVEVKDEINNKDEFIGGEYKPSNKTTSRFRK